MGTLHHLHARDSNNSTGRDVCLVLGCIAAFMVIIVIAINRTRVYQYFQRVTGHGSGQSAQEPKTSHVNPAELMRLCAIRDNARPRKKGLGDFEIDTVAPMVMYCKTTSQRDNAEGDKSTTVPTITIKPLDSAVIRDVSKPEDSTHQMEDRKPSNTSKRVTFAEPEQGPLPVIPTPEQDLTVCSFCLEGFRDNEIVRETVCSHVFHSRCLEIWLRKKGRCPLCQKDLRSKPARQ